MFLQHAQHAQIQAVSNQGLEQVPEPHTSHSECLASNTLFFYNEGDSSSGTAADHSCGGVAWGEVVSQLAIF